MMLYIRGCGLAGSLIARLADGALGHFANSMAWTAHLNRLGIHGLAKTCAKLGVGFWDYPGSRLGAPGSPVIPTLPGLVRQRATA